MATQATAPIAVEYYPDSPDRLIIEVGAKRWQIFFSGRTDLRRYLSDAVKYRGLPAAASREAWEHVEAWWSHESEVLDEPRPARVSVREIIARVFCVGALAVVLVDLYLGAILWWEMLR